MLVENDPPRGRDLAPVEHVPYRAVIAASVVTGGGIALMV
jgi:hypothetical protein